MNCRIICTIFTALLVLWSPSGHSIGLGEIRVNSSLTMPLNAMVPVNGLRRAGISLEDFNIYITAGLDQEILYRLESSGIDTAILHLYTSKAVTESIFNLNVEMRWSKGLTARQYNLLIDPPDQTTSSNVTNVTNSDNKTTAASDSSRYGPTAGNTSLWIIATQLKTASNEQSIYQWVYAIWKNNPDAFVNANMHRLKRGVYLDIPSTEEINKVSRQNAYTLVQDQLTQKSDGSNKSEPTPETNPLPEITVTQSEALENTDTLQVEETSSPEAPRLVEEVVDINETLDSDEEEIPENAFKEELDNDNALDSKQTNILIEEILLEQEANTMDEIEFVESFQDQRNNAPTAEINSPYIASDSTQPQKYNAINTIAATENGSSVSDNQSNASTAAPPVTDKIITTETASDVFSLQSINIFKRENISEITQTISNNILLLILVAAVLIIVPVLMMIHIQRKSLQRKKPFSTTGWVEPEIRKEFDTTASNITVAKQHKKEDSESLGSLFQTMLEDEQPSVQQQAVMQGSTGISSYMNYLQDEEQGNAEDVTNSKITTIIKDEIEDVLARADVLRAYGKSDMALRLLQKTLLKNPDAIEIKIHLLKIYHKSGSAVEFKSLLESCKDEIAAMNKNMQIKVESMHSDLFPYSNPVFEHAEITEIEIDEEDITVIPSPNVPDGDLIYQMDTTSASFQPINDDDNDSLRFINRGDDNEDYTDKTGETNDDYSLPGFDLDDTQPTSAAQVLKFPETASNDQAPNDFEGKVMTILQVMRDQLQQMNERLFRQERESHRLKLAIKEVKDDIDITALEKQNTPADY